MNEHKVLCIAAIEVEKIFNQWAERHHRIDEKDFQLRSKPGNISRVQEKTQSIKSSETIPRANAVRGVLGCKPGCSVISIL